MAGPYGQKGVVRIIFIWTCSGSILTSRISPSSMMLIPISGSTTSRSAERSCSACAGCVEVGFPDRVGGRVVLAHDRIPPDGGSSATSKVQESAPCRRQLTRSTGSARAEAMNAWSTVHTSGCLRPMRKYGTAQLADDQALVGLLHLGLEAFLGEQLHHARQTLGKRQPIELGRQVVRHAVGHPREERFNRLGRGGFLEFIEQAAGQAHVAAREQVEAGLGQREQLSRPPDTVALDLDPPPGCPPAGWRDDAERKPGTPRKPRPTR